MSLGKEARTEQCIEVKDSENKDMLDTFMSILEAAGILNGWTEFKNKYGDFKNE